MSPLVCGAGIVAMANVKSVTGVCAAWSVVALVLQGCGDSSDPTTSPPAGKTTTPEPSPVAACMAGWGSDECCCQHCPSMWQDKAFDVLNKNNCTAMGGQCKPESEVFMNSYYLRPPPAALAHPSLRDRSADGGSEQHHVIGGEPDEVTIVFVHPGEKMPLTVELRVNGSDQQPSNYSTVTSSYSFFENPQGWNGYSGSSRGWEYFDCESQSGHAVYQNATCMYTSDIIYKAQITGLMANTAYNYRVQGEGDWRTFATPPAIGSPISIAVVADLGQTTDSKATMDHMKTSFDAGDFHTVVFPGDLSYADGYAPFWDSYGRLADFFFSMVPTAYGVGNHDATSGFENNINFLPRYGWDSSKTTSSSPLWFSYDAGLAHVIMLCSYCDTTAGSAQYFWLQRDLADVNRSLTPWVVMAWHIPFYSSSLNHPMEELPNVAGAGHADGFKQRADLEHMIYDAKVDVVFQGHVHSYERTLPVFNNETTCDAPVYITIGDGGNHEGPACGWVGDFPWSAKKETSFGFGVLAIANATDAEWVWHRNQDGARVAADTAALKIASTRCGASNAAAAVPVGAVTV